MVGLKRRPRIMVCRPRIAALFWLCWICSPIIVLNIFLCSLPFIPRVVEGFLVQHPTGMMVRGIRGCNRVHKTTSNRRSLLAPQIMVTADTAGGEKKKKKESKRGRPKGSRSSKSKSLKGNVADKNASKKKKKTRKKKSASQDPLYWREDTDLFKLETRSLSPLQSGNDTAVTINVTQLTDCQMIRFTVRGKPIPLRRHRTSRGFMYNPSARAQEAFKDVVRNMTFPEHDPTCSRPLFSEEKYLEMNLVFRLRRPRKDFIGGKSGPGRLRPTAPQRLAPTRSDVDNLAKFVLDSLNELLYVDDRQIVSLRATKVLDTEGDCLGATEVCIRIFTEDDVQGLLCQ